MAMKKISSGQMLWVKKIFPLLWFGFLALFLVMTLVSGAYRQAPVVLIAPLAMTVFGYFLMKHLVWDLADAVFDGGDFLLVQKGDREERVPLANIMNVSASVAMNPPRITLRLVRPGKFGGEIAFSPVRTFTLNPFAKNPVAEDLMLRVDQARRGRPA